MGLGTLTRQRAQVGLGMFPSPKGCDLSLSHHHALKTPFEFSDVDIYVYIQYIHSFYYISDIRSCVLQGILITTYSAYATHSFFIDPFFFGYV